MYVVFLLMKNLYISPVILFVKCLCTKGSLLISCVSIQSLCVLVVYQLSISSVNFMLY